MYMRRSEQPWSLFKIQSELLVSGWTLQQEKFSQLKHWIMKPLVLTYWLCKLRIKGFRSREGQLWMCQSMSLMSTTMRQNSSICNLMWKNLKIFWLASRTMQRYVFFSPSFLSFTLYFLRRLALKAQDFLSLNVLKEFYQNIWIRSCCVNYLYSYLYIRHGKSVR